MRYGSPEAQIHPGQIYGQQVIPLLGSPFVERRLATHSGIVEHDRDPTHGRCRGINGAAQSVGVGDIGHVGGSTDLRGNLVGGITVDVYDSHQCALVSHAPRRCPSDARAAPGYDGTLAFK